MPDEAFDRLPPSNLDAERAALGACLLDREALVNVTELLSPDDFYDLNYRDVYNVIVEMTRTGKPVDMLTLSAGLQDRGLLDKLGGQSFLAAIIDSTPTAANAEYHARIVRDKAIRRRLISAGNAIARMGYDESKGILDPWGRPYQVILDVDFDGKIKSSIDAISAVNSVNNRAGQDLRSKVAVYSYGVKEDDKDASNLNKLAAKKKLVISW